MNKLTKIILSITGAGVIMAAGNEALPSAVAMDKVNKAYQSSGQLKEKYKLQDSKFVIEAKDKNKVKVELGETNSADFEPSLTFSRWEGEAKFKIKPDISKVKKNNKGIEIDGDKIKYKAGKVDYVSYELPATTTDEGGFEWEIILNEKPASNVFTTAIESTGVEFYKQKPLNEEQQEEGTTCTATECKDTDGNITASRPENVVNSIAVYSDSKAGNYEAMGGYNYMAGKVAHIYRVKAVDANNDWAWCDQDITGGVWTKTCPQDFLDKAVYPVVVDPTFGYTSNGNSSIVLDTSSWAGSKFSGAAGTGDKMTGCLSGGTKTAAVKANIYKISDLAQLTNGITTATSASDHAKAAEDYNFVSAPTLSAVDYLLVFAPTISVLPFQKAYLYYDSGDANQGYSITNSAFPATITTYTNNTNKYSIYATYTEGGGARRRMLITE